MRFFMRLLAWMLIVFGLTLVGVWLSLMIVRAILVTWYL